MAFGEAGLGPNSKVGLYLYNGNEYLETQFACMKGRSVAININYRYLDDELLYLLDNSDAEALVFHTSLGDRVARVMEVTGPIFTEQGTPAADGLTPEAIATNRFIDTSVGLPS